jgi:uroporphyrinogen III methyltransferase/synthase
VSRVLVVRSGQVPFVSPGQPLRIEVVEKVSHRIVPALSGDAALDAPIELAVFTSRVAVARLFEEERIRARFARALSRGRVAAVGGRTAEALRRFGVEPAIVASGSVRSVLEQLPRSLEGWRVLLPRGDDAGEELPEELERRGASVARLLLYRKVPRPADSKLSQEILERPFRAFCVTSAAAGRWLFEGLSREGVAALTALPAVVLGDHAAKALEGFGVARVEVAPEATFACAGRLLESLARARPAE